MFGDEVAAPLEEQSHADAPPDFHDQPLIGEWAGRQMRFEGPCSGCSGNGGPVSDSLKRMNAQVFLTLPFRVPEDRTLDGLDCAAGGKLDLVLNPNRLERLVPPVRGAEVHHHMRRVPDWLNGGHDGTSALGCWVPDGGAG